MKIFFYILVLICVSILAFADDIYINIDVTIGNWKHYKVTNFQQEYIGLVTFYDDGTFKEIKDGVQRTGTYYFFPTEITMDYTDNQYDFEGGVTIFNENYFYVNSDIDRKFIRNPF